jgi:hypothetical protein
VIAGQVHHTNTFVISSSLPTGIPSREQQNKDGIQFFQEKHLAF